MNPSNGAITVLSPIQGDFFVGTPIVNPTFNENMGHVYFCPSNKFLLTMDIETGKFVSSQEIKDENEFNNAIRSIYYAENF